MRAGALLAGLLPLAAAADPALPDWSGCWRFERQGQVYEEFWFAPIEDGALGVARSSRDGHARNQEMLRLARVEGRWHLIVYGPNGLDEVAFGLLERTDDQATFENPEHDFPQRIVYRMDGPDRLVARIEGRLDGQTRDIDFPYERSACPGGQAP